MYLEPTPGLLEPQEQHEPGCGCERKLPRAVDQPALQPPVSIQDEQLSAGGDGSDSRK